MSDHRKGDGGMLTEAEARQFYNSGAWHEKRQQILQRDHYECQDCRARLRKAAATGETLHGWERTVHRARCVHHIQELREHPELALADDNLVALCPMCHNIRHGRDPFAWKTQKFQAKPRLTSEKW